MSAQKLDKMNKLRYIFNAVYFNKYIYVLGGRDYGNDETAVLKNCERFNLISNKWETIADLNIARCSAMSITLDNFIVIGGGFVSPQKRECSFESYAPDTNTWCLMGIELIEPLEGNNEN